jgi:hypothetical protein
MRSTRRRSDEPTSGTSRPHWRKCPIRQTDRADKSPSVSSVSDQGRHVSRDGCVGTPMAIRRFFDTRVCVAAKRATALLNARPRRARFSIARLGKPSKRTASKRGCASIRDQSDGVPLSRYLESAQAPFAKTAIPDQLTELKKAILSVLSATRVGMFRATMAPRMTEANRSGFFTIRGIGVEEVDLLGINAACAHPRRALG